MSAFRDEMERQIWDFQNLGYAEVAGFDVGQWYGGFASQFYRDGDNREDGSRSVLADLDMAPVDSRVPFVFVVGEMTVSFPKQLHLLNGGLWNGGGTGKPSLTRASFGLPSRAWLALDVRIHQWHPGGNDWVVYQTLLRAGRRMANLCDVLALGIHFPAELARCRAFGAFGSPEDPWSVPYVHASTNDYEVQRGLPEGKPNVFTHAVGPNTTNGGGGAVVTVGGYLTVEDVDRRSFQRYSDLVDRGERERFTEEVLEQ